MTQNVVALQLNDTLATAIKQMREKRIRHLPIVSGRGEFLGLITHRDLLAASGSTLAKESRKKQQLLWDAIPVARLMHKRVRTTTPDADVREIAILMRKNKWGCLPVLRGKTLAGIVTATDFLTLSINLLSLHEKLQSHLQSGSKG